jgi:hypothetical protein
MTQRTLKMACAALLVAHAAPVSAVEDIACGTLRIVAGAAGLTIAEKATCLAEKALGHLAKGVLANIDAHRLEGVDKGELAKRLPNMTFDEAKAYVETRRKEAAKQASCLGTCKSYKQWLYYKIGHQGAENSAPFVSMEHGQPLLTKDGKTFSMPFIEPTCWWSKKGNSKYYFPFVRAALTIAPAFILYKQTGKWFVEEDKK